MTGIQPPTQRELEILKILWRNEEATVREVYEELRTQLDIVQNTVQAFLRTMEEKGQVSHRVEGRTFIYRAAIQPEDTRQRLVDRVLNRVFDGALDQMVQSALSLRQPSDAELDRLERLIADAKSRDRKPSRKKKQNDDVS